MTNEPPSLLRRSMARIDERAQLHMLVQGSRFNPGFFQAETDQAKLLACWVYAVVTKAKKP